MRFLIPQNLVIIKNTISDLEENYRYLFIQKTSNDVIIHG